MSKVYSRQKPYVLIVHKIEDCAQEALSWEENRNSYQGSAGRPFALLFIGVYWFGAMESNTISLQTNIKNIKRASSLRPTLVVWLTYRAPVAARLHVPGRAWSVPKSTL